MRIPRPPDTSDESRAVHVAGYARDIQRLSAVVPLHEGDHLGRHLSGIHQPADL
jgi:hypothetical protein